MGAPLRHLRETRVFAEFRAAERVEQRQELTLVQDDQVQPAAVAAPVQVGQRIGRLFARQARRKHRAVQRTLGQRAVGPQPVGHQRGAHQATTAGAFAPKQRGGDGRVQRHRLGDRPCR
jgi:hypothetical protein